MKFGKFDLRYLLSAALGVTFLSNSLSGFFTPDEFTGIIQHAFLFNKVLDVIPFFVTLIGVNDLIVCVLLLSGKFPKVTAWWAVSWITIVIVVFLANFSVDGLFTALEHGAPLGVALYLVYTAKK